LYSFSYVLLPTSSSFLRGHTKGFMGLHLLFGPRC
jgi:hypothetical protein